MGDACEIGHTQGSATSLVPAPATPQPKLESLSENEALPSLRRPGRDSSAAAVSSVHGRFPPQIWHASLNPGQDGGDFFLRSMPRSPITNNPREPLLVCCAMVVRMARTPHQPL